jgi:2-keto-3-deoxy-L-rhamnonate aldolase RhmA
MALPPNPLRQRLAEGGLALGLGVHHLRGSAVGMIAAAAGYDWLFIDMEHGAMSVDDAACIAIAALGQGVTPLVRVCKDALHEGTRCLDNGAMGVIVPHVDTAEEARAVARAYRFPPVGSRSWGGPPFAHGLGPVEPASGQAELNREILVACMVETPEAVANADAIAAVPGVDVLLIGTSDLTATMGIPGQIGTSGCAPPMPRSPPPATGTASSSRWAASMTRWWRPTTSGSARGWCWRAATTPC